MAECTVDAQVRLVLRVPGGRPLIALGEVRHRTEALEEEFFGVEFMELADCHRAQIEAYIERRLREEREAESHPAWSGRRPATTY
jgi:hypothetical protein